MPRAADTGEPELARAVAVSTPTKPGVPFPTDLYGDSNVFQNAIVAKLAIAKYFGRPLGSLPEDDCAFIAEVLAKTLNKQEVMSSIKAYFARKRQKRR